LNREFSEVDHEVKHTQPFRDCQSFFMPGGFLSSILKNYEYRDAQLKMAEAVAGALDRRTTLLVEAATGTGKTWAYLIPAILSGKKVIISTGTKTLQDQLYLKDLPFLSESLPFRFTFSMMKGKSNYLCLHRFGQSLQQPSFEGFEAESHFETVRQWSLRTRTGDRSEIAELPETTPLWQEVSVKGEACLGTQCQSYDRCYITLMRQAAAASDIVIVNHHLFFADLALKEASYGEILPHYDAVIFDEAHLLEEVATQYFGISISSYRMEDFVYDAEREFRYLQTAEAGCFEQCKRILSASNRFFHFFGRGEERYRLKGSDFSEDVLTAGNQLSESLQRLREQIGALRLKSEAVAHLCERIEGLTSDLQLFLTIDEAEGEYVYWTEKRRQAVFLYASPLDVSALLRERLFERKTPVILTSATLASGKGFDFVRERLGIETADEMVLATPFEYEKQALIYLPTHLPNPSDRNFSAAISVEIIRILKESQGRAFLLFTSWKNMEEVYLNLLGRLPYLLLKQGDQPKQILIDAFKRDVSSVLLGTTSFWQGVDIPGESLSCVIIDKLPFSSPTDPLVAARVDSLLQKGKDPFLTFQLPSAVLSLRQGIGRLIRTKDDRGLIAILDRRMTKKDYGKHFLSTLPSSRRTASFDEVRSFFSACRNGP
jgi:ATP-dependent DNA helicase DinG